MLPRSAADALPRSRPGIIGAVADRLDSLAGLAAAGCLPTASADAFGMRRITYGLLQTLIGNGVHVDVAALLDAAGEAQPVACGADVRGEVLVFVAKRLEQLLLDRGVCARVHALCCAVACGLRAVRTLPPRAAGRHVATALHCDAHCMRALFETHESV